MPSFFSDLRRRSNASFKGDLNADSASSGTGSNESTNDLQPNRRSFNSLTSHFKSAIYEGGYGRKKSDGSLSGPSLHSGQRTPPVSNDKRPSLNTGPGSRYSIAGSPALSPAGRSVQYTSPLAPNITSVSEGSWVHQKVLLVSGSLIDCSQPLDGQITIFHHQDSFPSTQWQVSDCHFKALIHLQPGPNRVRLDFSPVRRSLDGNISVHTAWFNVNYLPLNSAPPLHLAILVAKDSPMTFDAVPERIKREGNGIETAIRKFRMAGYLWQAFTGEQMNRYGLGRRCFRFDEEWQCGTLSNRDFNSGTFRNEAKIHIIRLEQTVAEIQDLNNAQQNPNATSGGKLFEFAMDACRNYFQLKPGQKRYVSAMFMDTRWDKEANLVRGHAAIGGGDGSLFVGIFGSHALQSYPSHIEEVFPAFNDCTRTDTDFVANDCNESGSSWEAANIGIGAHLHETGHLLGCPHQESGIMLREYVTLNRTFCVKESYSTRTKSAGIRLCQQSDECSWHRLDVLRFRFHPCFALPSDVPQAGEDDMQIWAVDGNAATITASSGLAWVEIREEGVEVCHAWIEFVDLSNGLSNAPRQITLTEAEIRQRMQKSDPSKKLQLQIFTCKGESQTIDDFVQLVGKSSKTKLPDGRAAFRSMRYGAPVTDNSQNEDIIFQSAFAQTKILLSVRIYHGMAVDGIEFFYEDMTSQLFGKRGGKEGGDVFSLDARRGEAISGFYVRAGAWIDAIQILTSAGRKSDIYGNATNGSGHTIMPPRGYNVAGIFGSCGGWMDSFGLIISR